MKLKPFKSVHSPFYGFMGTALRGRLQGKTVFGSGYLHIGKIDLIFVDTYFDDGKNQELSHPGWRRVEPASVRCGFCEIDDEEPKTEAQWTNN